MSKKSSSFASRKIDSALPLVCRTSRGPRTGTVVERLAVHFPASFQSG